MVCNVSHLHISNPRIVRLVVPIIEYFNIVKYCYGKVGKEIKNFINFIFLGLFKYFSLRYQNDP